MVKPSLLNKLLLFLRAMATIISYYFEELWYVKPLPQKSVSNKNPIQSSGTCFFNCFKRTFPVNERVCHRQNIVILRSGHLSRNLKSQPPTPLMPRLCCTARCSSISPCEKCHFCWKTKRRGASNPLYTQKTLGQCNINVFCEKKMLVVQTPIWNKY